MLQPPHNRQPNPRARAKPMSTDRCPIYRHGVRPGLRWLLLAGTCWLAACASPPRSGAIAPPRGPVAEPALVRPVIVVERAQSELVAALELLKAGNLRQAEVNLEEIIKARPDIPEAHFNLGWARQRLDRHTEAIGHFRDGLKLQPDNVRALNLMGLSQRELGHFTEAEQTFRQATATAPGFDKPHLNLGILYELYLRRRPAAIEHYRHYQALQATPDPKVAAWINWLEKEGKTP